MASSPQVTAIISAIDKASPVIDKMLAHTRQVSDETVKAAERATTAHSVAMDSFAARAGAFAKHLDTVAAGASAAFGGHFLREIGRVDIAMDRLERKMVAFGGVTREQAVTIRQTIDTQYAGNVGGPEGQMDQARQLLFNGVRADQYTALMGPVSAYASETGLGNAEAATEFLSHMQMLHRIRDDNGKEISLAAATHDQLSKSAIQTFSIVSEVAKNIPGTMQDILTYSKVAAPSSVQLKVPDSVMFAEEGVLAQAGIRGEVAGTAVAGMNRRLISQPAKGRAAMVEAGLHYSDYVTLDPNLITTKGTTAAFELRAGTANAGERAKINSAVEKFHRDRDFDAFNVTLTDAFVSSGNKGLKNRVAAANAANDISKGAVTGVDDVKLLQDIHDKNVPVGLIQTMFRENANAVMIMSQSIGELKRLADHFEHTDHEKNYNDANAARIASISGAVDNLTGSWEGLKSELGKSTDGLFVAPINAFADAIKNVGATSQEARSIIMTGIGAATLVGTLKTAGTVVEWGAKLVAAGEEMGPLVGALASLSALEFGPVVLGITGLVAAVEAVNNRAAIAHWLDNYNKGTFDTPVNDEQDATLTKRRDDDIKKLADRAAVFENMQPHDMQLEDLKQQRLSKHADLSVQFPSDPAIDAAQGRLDGLDDDIEKNPNVAAARARVDQIQNELLRIEAAKSDEVTARRADLSSHMHDNVDESDPRLSELRQSQANLRADKGDWEAPTEYDDEIAQRHGANQAEYDSTMDMKRRLLLQAQASAAGVVPRTAGDLAAAQTDLTTAHKGASDALEALRDQLRVELDTAKTSHKKWIDGRPEIQALNMKIAEEEARNRASFPVDDEQVRLSLEISRINAARLPYILRGLALQQTGMEIGDGPHYANKPGSKKPDYDHPIYPNMPPVDYTHNASPQAATFGLGGALSQPVDYAHPPVHATLPAYEPLPLAAPAATKVDVNSAVTVSGKADVTTKVDLTLNPSRYFDGLVKRAEALGSVQLSGRATDDQMRGPNGTREPELPFSNNGRSMR